MSTGGPGGAIAAGHPETVRAARHVLEAGGNAFDAVLAGVAAACVAEPVLASPGGGGFLMARSAAEPGQPRVYDFFAQTPKQARPETETEFFPIIADFGTAQQEFHIGLGASATPGLVAGMFAVHRDLATMPFARIVEPALHLARGGITINAFQAYLFGVVQAIYRHYPESRALYGSSDGQSLVREGDRFVNPALGDLLDALANEGERLFYEGEVAAEMERLCREGGGHLTRADFAGYEVVRRTPLRLDRAGATVWTNPPPSTGGILVAFALRLLEGAGLADLPVACGERLARLAAVMETTNRARLESGLSGLDAAAYDRLLDPAFVGAYRAEVLGRPASLRGTTHISVVDAEGNAAAMTVSNGEGCGHLVPGTGFMLNNMLGEEDINPRGFHRWPEDTRLCSMMAPTLLQAADGSATALGSGGSNRIRTAILQVLLNLLDHGMTLEDAVHAPRLHFEDGLLSIEDDLDEGARAHLEATFEAVRPWPERNMFFGGVHAVSAGPGHERFAAAGDARRGGASAIL